MSSTNSNTPPDACPSHDHQLPASSSSSSSCIIRPGAARLVRSNDLETSASKWLGLKSIDWVDQTGKQRIWESSYRKTTDQSSSRPVDAVAIFTLITRPQTPPSTIIILQYRPPVDKVVVELPAGLIDPGETVEQAALRELYEETGYGKGPHGGKAVVEKTSEVLVNDPGMSNANMILAEVAVRFDNHTGVVPPEPHQEQGEHIQVLVLPIEELYKTLQDYNQQPGFVVDARLMHLAFGLSIQSLSSSS